MTKFKTTVVALSAIAYGSFVQAQGNEPPSFVYPQERTYGAHKAILHAPQIEAWPDFATFDGVMAIEFLLARLGDR